MFKNLKKEQNWVYWLKKKKKKKTEPLSKSMKTGKQNTSLWNAKHLLFKLKKISQYS